MFENGGGNSTKDSCKEREGREDKGNCGNLKCLRVFVTLHPNLSDEGSIVQHGTFMQSKH